ncbi:MaoC family dehydratase [Conexibacter sp. DBS9H8]|uniref:MaoC family dehydratase n=1 Tax=Conexibacter sp. DBS9H8 TaxID=2937801 RepID=UPI00200CD048|nr:MaoC family dehydratase [Conexibacter sp. DBS9H8]
MRTLAEVFEDPNPIHLDRAAVGALGMGDALINQGPANIAYIYNMLRYTLPDATVEQLSVRLLANVREGDRVIAGGEVLTERREGGRSWLSCRVWLDVANRARAIDGTAELLLPA